VLIMEKLSLKDRLSSCCRVSRRLHAAAVAATPDITGRQPPDIWIFKYGHNLTHLRLEGYQHRLRLAAPTSVQSWERQLAGRVSSKDAQASHI
jgi:hypothetical protein